MKNPDVAIIGIACLFPGAEDKDAYWRNIIRKTYHLADAPAEWSEPYYDPRQSTPRIDSGRIYTRKVGLFGELAKFNPLEFGIPPSALAGADPGHFIALKLARDALWDAGYATRPFARERVGVIVGRGANPHRADVTGIQYGLVLDQTMALCRQFFPNAREDTLRKLQEALKRDLPKVGNEQAPFLVSNVTSGRIANRLDLMGPNYIVDGACASGLIAADLAISDLMAHRCDMMLAGGIQASMPPQVYMLFSALGALSSTDVRPFDEAANGTLLSEGAGFVVLKRLPDAVRDGDRIYAVIKGIGIASDGKAQGLLAPRLEGEALALRRAYERTGIDPATVDLVEAHGTGIPLGDLTEIQALTSVFGPRAGRIPHCALGSVKSMIGHCIPAAGIASLIKISLSLYHKVLPPTLCERVNPELGITATPFYINTELRPWIHGAPTPRRAGIDAFGFGGINAHAILEEFPDIPVSNYAGITASFTKKPTHRQGVDSRDKDPAPKTLASPVDSPPDHPPDAIGQNHVWATWPTEMLVFAGEDRAAVFSSVQRLLEQLQDNPPESLARLGYTLSRQAHDGGCRLAIIARGSDDLIEKLSFAHKKLADEKTTRIVSIKKGVYYAKDKTPDGKLAFLFSSEGSQYPDMLSDLCLYFPKIRGWFDFLDATYPRAIALNRLIFPPPTGLADSDREWMAAQLLSDGVAGESVTTSSFALYELLHDFGIGCDMMVGHSSGEHVALRVSGKAKTRSLDDFQKELRALNDVYAQLETNHGVMSGTLLSVGGVAWTVVEELQEAFPGAVYLVADNCPSQMILFTKNEVTEAVTGKLKSLGALWIELPFNRCYHTPLYEKGARALDAFYGEKLEPGESDVDVYSCNTTEPYPPDAAVLHKLATEQWVK
ncbi:MAG: type I polyketide synthase, partial [Gammaproteobacteria bacterium]|nr:type I polyketide synthase [Gammaproteobacteria bacterium]NNJ84267.1 type I polyketide synthase [Gammaproteobacteria bacterium]